MVMIYLGKIKSWKGRFKIFSYIIWPNFVVKGWIHKFPLIIFRFWSEWIVLPKEKWQEPFGSKFMPVCFDFAWAISRSKLQISLSVQPDPIFIILTIVFSLFLIRVSYFSVYLSTSAYYMYNILSMCKFIWCVNLYVV